MVRQKNMRMNGLQKLSFVAGLVGVLLIGVLSVVPGTLRPHLGHGIPNPIEHIFAYFAATVCLGLARRWPPWAIVSALTCYSIILEVLQIWVPSRSPEVIDVVASSAGAVTGLVAAAILRRASLHFLRARLIDSSETSI
jgi:VanZ family protein